MARPEGIPPVRDLVPHRPPMLLVDRLLACARDRGVAEATVQGDHPLIHPAGHLDPVASVELVAQTAAAMEGAHAPEKGLPRGGIVGVPRFEFHGAARPGELLRVEVTRGEPSRVFRTVRGRVSVGDRAIASGELKLVVGEAARGLAPTVGAPSTPAAGRAAEGLHALLARAFVGPARETTLRLGEELTVFHGHFPGAPVLPAAATLAIVVSVAAEPGGVLRRVERARFPRAIHPRTTLRLSSVPVPGAPRGWLAATVLADGEEAATLRLFVEPPDRAGGPP